jgi:hypothetical protein
MVAALMRDIEVGVVNLMVLRREGARTAWHYTHRLARVDRHLLQPPSMAGHTDIFPKNLFWYHLLTALAYKTPGPIIDKDLIGNTKGIT